MIDELIGNMNDGIRILLYRCGEYQEVNLDPEETIELKKFLDENLK